MIIVLKPSTSPEQIQHFADKLCSDYGVKVNRWDGVQSTVLGLIGDTHNVDIEYIARSAIKNIGYASPECGFDANTCGMILSIFQIAIESQSYA